MRRLAHTLTLALALAVALTAAACGDDANKLDGSLTDVYDMSFDSVHVSTVGSDYLVVEYLRGQAKPAKLTTIITGLTIQPDVDIDLTEEVGGMARGTLQRIVDNTIDLPIEVGTLTLASVPAAGETLVGRFRTRLSDPAGYTLNGDFEAVVEAR